MRKRVLSALGSTLLGAFVALSAAPAQAIPISAPAALKARAKPLNLTWQCLLRLWMRWLWRWRLWRWFWLRLLRPAAPLLLPALLRARTTTGRATTTRTTTAIGRIGHTTGPTDIATVTAIDPSHGCRGRIIRGRATTSDRRFTTERLTSGKRRRASCRRSPRPLR